MLDDLVFQNRFVEFVYHTILSQHSKQRLVKMLTDPVNIPIFQDGLIKKFIVKTKPQQVIVFIGFQKKQYVVKGYQFGRSDYLTGRKKAHLATVQGILTSKTDSEIAQWY